jgi:catechol 2,3-dioxygenase-like lactoylglutathione lyase family enzyme
MALALAVNHVSLTVTDLDRSLAFWSGILGLEPLPRPALGVDGAWLGVGSSAVHLIVLSEGRTDVGATPRTINPAAPHVALTVADYDDTVAQLRAAGLELVETNAARGQCWVQDPDGYIIEFITTR